MHISGKQVACLLCISVIISGLLILPALLVRVAGRDGWLSLFPGWVVGAVTITAVVYLWHRWPQMTLIEIAGCLAGRFARLATGCWFGVLYFLAGAIVLRVLLELLGPVFMPETPIWALGFLLMVTVVYGVSGGIEVMARAAEIITPLMVLPALVMCLLAYPEFELSALLPLLAKGWQPVLAGWYRVLPFFSAVVFTGLLLPYVPVEEQQQVLRKLLYSMTLSTGVLLITFMVMVIVEEGLMPYFVFPYLMLVRNINLADIVERIESLLVIIWIGGGIVKLALYSYLALSSLVQGFNYRLENISYQFWWVAATGAGTLFCAIYLWPDTHRIVATIEQITPFVVTGASCWPIVLCLLALRYRK